MALAWITGGHGFIGRYLARELRGKNYDVSGLGHGKWPQSEFRGQGFLHWLNADISASSLEQLHQLTGLPDVIFHLAGGSSVGAAIANPYEDFTRTVGTTANLLEWMRQHAKNTRLAAVSSAAVYGVGHSGAVAEDAKTSPASPYGVHKLMMESLCRSYAAHFDLRVVLPRLFSVYGAGLKKQLLWDMCNKVASGNKVELGGSGDEERDWIEVRDAAAALEQVAALASPDSPAINLASGAATSVREIAGMAISCWSTGQFPAKKVTFSGKPRPGDPFSLVADISQMQTHGLKNHIPLSQGVREYVEWYLSQIDSVQL